MKKGIKKFLSIFIRVCITWGLVYINKIDFGVKTAFDEISFVLTIYSLISYYFMIVRITMSEEQKENAERGYSVIFVSDNIVGSILLFAWQLIQPLIFMALIIGGIPALIGLILPDSIETPVQMAITIILLLVPIFKDIFDIVILLKPDLVKKKNEKENKKDEVISDDHNLYGPNEDMTYEEYQRYLEKK